MQGYWLLKLLSNDGYLIILIDVNPGVQIAKLLQTLPLLLVAHNVTKHKNCTRMSTVIFYLYGNATAP